MRRALQDPCIIPVVVVVAFLMAAGIVGWGIGSEPEPVHDQEASEDTAIASAGSLKTTINAIYYPYGHWLEIQPTSHFNHDYAASLLLVAMTCSLHVRAPSLCESLLTEFGATLYYEDGPGIAGVKKGKPQWTGGL